ncbi:MAG: RNA polymerase-binding protein DksA [Epsilonproteobacteria bacterium]|nr:RNA polymerase-binding protein DksA [Campylobacterota bacterium]
MQESELKYFKEILESRKVQILKNISGVNDELNQLSALELNDEGDHASVTNNSMVENAICMQQEKELKEINVALSKIEHRQYGICEMCEDPIGFQRLKVKPHAVYCIDCREIVEKSNNA